MPEKKTSHRRKPVVEEVVEEKPVITPEPVVEPEPVVAESTPEALPQTETVDTEAQAKVALSELETAHSEHRKSKRGLNIKLLFVLTMLVALVVGFLAGGLYVYTQGMQSKPVENEQEETPDPTEEPTPEPTATPEPVDVSEYTTSVLNGSGKIGEAGKVEALLDDAGFTVGNTGNAARYNYTDTVIQAQEDVPEEVVELLEEAVSEGYSVEIGDELPASSTYDIVVTVGSSTD